MHRKSKSWPVSEFAALAKLTNERIIYIWGGQGQLGRALRKRLRQTKVNLEMKNGRWLVVNDGKARAVIAERSRVAKKAPAVLAKKPAPTTPAKSSGAAARQALAFKEIEPMRPASTKRYACKLPPSFAFTFSETRLVRKRREAARWLGLTMGELEARRLPFVIVDGEPHLIARYVEELKSELDVDKRLAA